MGVRPLDNTAWGFESSCFVCEPSNPGGLRIPFFHDEDAGLVVADYTLDATFSGAPTYVHGGITLAVLDEAMAWAAIALADSFALTRTTTAHFLRPVRVGHPHRVEARVTSRTGERIDAEATVLDGQGRPCARAAAQFVPMSAAHARSAMGTEVVGDDAGYLRS